MSDKDTGGPAFPQNTSQQTAGMTLRDYFAAKALQGFIGTDAECEMDFLQVAETTYRYADAMLKARNQ